MGVLRMRLRWKKGDVDLLVVVLLLVVDEVVEYRRSCRMQLRRSRAGGGARCAYD